jgi:hypothetical protein
VKLATLPLVRGTHVKVTSHYRWRDRDTNGCRGHVIVVHRAGAGLPDDLVMVDVDGDRVPYWPHELEVVPA